jgi:hypothetical protein
MKQIVTILFLVLSNSAIGQTKTNTDSITVAEPIHQLRIYKIPKENRTNFHNRFSDHAIRIMKKYGFTIVATWESEYKEKVEFVYLLEWRNEDFMKMAWDNFRPRRVSATNNNNLHPQRSAGLAAAKAYFLVRSIRLKAVLPGLSMFTA